MFQRNLLIFLDNWLASDGRKPLILRGARQTGKTVAVKLFGERFTHFVSLDLEREADRRIFERSDGIEQVIQAIELAKGRSLREQDTLLFIDEIQNSPKAMGLLRFFHEDHPSLAVICAGSLLEAVMRREGMSFPVGRVQFAYLHPATFDEFLGALGEDDSFRHCSTRRPSVPRSLVHDLALKRFHESLVGGMPEAVQTMPGTGVSSRSRQSKTASDRLRRGRVEVREHGRGEVREIRHPSKPPSRPGAHRIRAFREQRLPEPRCAGLSTCWNTPCSCRVRGSPRPLRPWSPITASLPSSCSWTRACRAPARAQDDALYVTDLNDLFRGALAEQAADRRSSPRTGESAEPAFWYRNRPGATVEVDYVLAFKGMLIPVEVQVRQDRQAQVAPPVPGRGPARSGGPPPTPATCARSG